MKKERNFLGRYSSKCKYPRRGEETSVSQKGGSLCCTQGDEGEFGKTQVQRWKRSGSAVVRISLLPTPHHAPDEALIRSTVLDSAAV